MIKKQMLLWKDRFFILAIKQGLTLAIPFLIMGSFALLIKSFPIDSYQKFLLHLLDGNVLLLLEIIYNITLGSLAFILMITISMSYARLMGDQEEIFYPLTAITSYIGFCGSIYYDSEYIFGAEWVFTAMCITLFSCWMLHIGILHVKKLEKIHTIGADYIFNISMQNLGPVIVIILFFIFFGMLLRTQNGDINITNFGSYVFLQIFAHLGNGLTSALLYVFCSHFLWFFGIHGTNTLEAVARRLFEQGVLMNQQLISLGKVPTQIFSKTFLDVFVFIGGCGSAVCLILALFIMAKKNHNKKLVKIAGVSVLFNISEVLIFGFPVIFNLVMLIPFILTPLVLTLISSAAMYLGLVPMVSHSVEWTVPFIISGYKATGSVAGSILQIINVAVGILIYIPFVKISEEKQSQEFQEEVKRMEKDMVKGEEIGVIPEFLSNAYDLRFSAHTLTLDLKNAMQRGDVTLYYQVQKRADGTLYGVEALLRWKHPVVGYLSPPLLINLANEGHFLDQLGYYIIEMACRDAEQIHAWYNQPMHISVNISPKQLEREDFVEQVLSIIEKYSLGNKKIILEITERVVLNTSEVQNEKLARFRESGLGISLDDFGMGHGSMTYLQNNCFDEVKLDGSLVRQLVGNVRSQEIVAGIIKMAKSLNFHVVAEYVETEEQVELLLALGCHIYQGYYYGKPQKLEEFKRTFLK